MKDAKRKTPQQLAAEAARKRAEKVAEWQRLAQRAGEATQFHFVSIIRRALDCEPQEAEKEFVAAVSAGLLTETRISDSGVQFWRAKKNTL